VDRLARRGNAEAIHFPVARLGPQTLDLSMSGLKTAVKLAVEREHAPLSDERRADIAASAERAIVQALIERLEVALDRYQVRAITISGGCACNTRLRREAERLAASRGIRALFPSPALCRDNGAMIAYAGWLALRRGIQTPYDATAIPNLDSFQSR
jgi:N6-L-threonylcarbamoyladenine synthase